MVIVGRLMCLNHGLSGSSLVVSYLIGRRSKRQRLTLTTATRTVRLVLESMKLVLKVNGSVATQLTVANKEHL
jgi:hypothetical protein